MRKLLIAIALTLIAGVAVAASVTCPLHSYASCYDTGQVSPTGSGAHKYRCSCGDSVWAK